MTLPSSTIFNETEIWLDEDITPVFDDKFWTIEFYIGLFIIIAFGIIHIICYTFLRPSRYDKLLQQLQLRVLNIEPVLRNEVEPILSPYINHNGDITDIIFEYSGFICDLDSIIKSSYDCKYKRESSGFSVLICITLIISYIFLYHSSAHITDSYRSFIEVPCVMHNCSTLTTRARRRRLADINDKGWDKCVYLFDLTDYHNTTDMETNYYGDIYMEYDYNVDDYKREINCYINEDTMKYRYFDKNGGCDCKCCYRCGRCCKCCYEGDSPLCACFDENCCLLMCTFSLGIVIGVLGCWWLLVSECVTQKEYHLRIKEKEYTLLKIKDSDHTEGDDTSVSSV